jgi:nicotinate-nucleotide adenylyltransferase
MPALPTPASLPRGLRVILGGSFDPVHCAHAALADAVHRACEQAELIWVPAAQSPFKSDAPQASAADRCALLEAFLAERPGERLDRRELERPAPSYSLDTLRSMQAEHPHLRFALALGADAFAGIPRWQGAAELLERVILLVAPRPGLARPEAKVPGHPQARVHCLAMPPVDLSSTKLRAALADGIDPGRAALPLSVFKTIQQRGLYGWTN